MDYEDVREGPTAPPTIGLRWQDAQGRVEAARRSVAESEMRLEKARAGLEDALRGEAEAFAELEQSRPQEARRNTVSGGSVSVGR